MKQYKSVCTVVGLTMLLAQGVSAALPTTTNVVLGEWCSNRKNAQDYAVEKGIPLVVVWGSSSCAYCKKFDTALETQQILDWRKERQLVMLYVKDDKNDSYKVPDHSLNSGTKVTQQWAYSGKNELGQTETNGKFPLILIYWEKDGNVLVERRFTGRDGLMPVKGGTTAAQFISTVEKYIGSYQSTREDQWDPDDNVRSSAQDLTFAKVWQSQAHTLSPSDTNDWFTFTLPPNTTNLVTFTDVEAVAGTPLYQFFNGTDTTPFKSGTLANDSSFEFENTSSAPSTIAMRVYYTTGADVDIAYTINYKMFVPVSVWFESTDITFSAGADTFDIPVVRGGDDPVLSANAEVTVTAQDMNALYSLVDTTLTWDSTSDDRTNLVVAVTPHNTWIGPQTFKLKLTPAGDETVDPFDEVTVTIDPGQPKTGTIGYTRYVVNGVTNNYSTSARPAVREGDTVTVLVARTGGSNMVAQVGFTWSSANGGDTGETMVWDDTEQGEQGVDILIPEVSAFQATRTSALQIFAITNATLETTSRRSLTFSVKNKFYAGPLTDWVKANPTLPFKATSDAWFLADGGEVRSKPLTGSGTAAMTASITGPGVLKFAATDGGANLALAINNKSTPVVRDGDTYGYLIPSGKQTVTLTASAGGAVTSVYALLSDMAYVPLTAAVTPIAPRAGDVIQAGTVRLSWDATSVAQLDGINGVTNTFAVFVGGTEKTLAKVADLEAGNTGFDVTLAAGAFVWRVAIEVRDDHGTVLLFNGAAQKFDVLGAGAPAFDVSPGDFSASGWTLDPDTAQLAVNTYIGLRTAFGPLAVANAASVKVKSGTLPSGLKLAQDTDGVWWVTGVPTKVANNARLVLQAMDGKTGGTTLALNYTVLALPREAYGNYNGWTTVAVGTDEVYGAVSMAVSAAGKISGKLTTPSKTYTLAVTGYDAFESGAFVITNDLFTAKFKKETPIPLTLSVSTNVPGRASLTSVTGVLFDATLNRDGWSDKEGLAVAREDAFRLALDYPAGVISKSPGGYYTLIMTNTDTTAGFAGTGYMTTTIDKKGKIKAAGKLADGTSVSLSSVLLMDASDVPYVALFSAPKAYSGGYFLAWSWFHREVLAPGRVLLDGEAVWESRNARATGVLNEGFHFGLNILGGWYAKNDTLKQMYADSEGWTAKADVLDVTVAFNAKGNGLNAIPAAENPASLKLSVKPKTGLFSGSFREVDGGKTVTRKLMGVLTPALVIDDGFGGLIGTAGAGYYLLPQTAPYKFNLSGDFVLEPDCGCGP